MLGHRDIENTVAVLFGGRSSEHEISLRSAVFILRNMPEKYRIIPVGIDRSGACYSLEGTFTAHDFEGAEVPDLAALASGKKMSALPRANVVESLVVPQRWDVVKDLPESPVRILNLEAGVFFPVLHGPNGEDGRFQGLFELAEVAYVGCDLRANVIGIDKNIQKRLARDAGVPVAAFEVVDSEEWGARTRDVTERIRQKIGFPCFVKPNALGSAVGVGKALDERELQSRVTEALRFDDKALVEEMMSGSEVECAFLGTGVSPRITVAAEIVTADFYSYDAKYLSEDGAQFFLPARLETDRMNELKGLAATLARVFGLEGLCRLDFWHCKRTGRFVFNEINTMPGLTSISQFPKLWEYEGVSGRSWIDELVVRAKNRQTRMTAQLHTPKVST